MSLRKDVPVWPTAGALLACYAQVLCGMADQWQAAIGSPSDWGIALLTAGAGLHVAAATGGGLFAGSLAFLLSLAGAVAALGGCGLLRAPAFPFLPALFMQPKLAIVYSQATLPLQLSAGRIAASGLTLVGVGVLREGNILQVRGHQIAVA